MGAPIPNVHQPFEDREKAMFGAATKVDLNGNWVSLRFNQGVKPEQHQTAFKTWVRENAGAGFTIQPIKPDKAGQAGLKVMIAGSLNDPKEVYGDMSRRLKPSRPTAAFKGQRPTLRAVQAASRPTGSVITAANEAPAQMAAQQECNVNAPGSGTNARPTSPTSAQMLA